MYIKVLLVWPPMRLAFEYEFALTDKLSTNITSLLPSVLATAHIKIPLKNIYVLPLQSL